VSGNIKCLTIKTLATQCLQLLSTNVENSVEHCHDYKQLYSDFVSQDASAILHSTSLRLSKLDVHAMHELGQLLLSPGCVTIHQFQNVVLPALHTALFGRRTEHDALLHFGRRSKKAKVVDDVRCSMVEVPEDRLEFCKQAVRLLITGDIDQREAASATCELGRNDGGENDLPNDDVGEMTGSEQMKYSDAAQEMLRRLHQLLSFHENVDIVTDIFQNDSSAGDGGDLQTLTKPIRLQLIRSDASLEDNAVTLFVHAEPLVAIEDLQTHIIGVSKILDISYLSFSQRYV
jgi:hypothetical protein